MLRYRETGELHKDFHGTTNTTIDYIARNYGEDALGEILTCTGKDVYKSIHEKLMHGDASELAEHLEYFYKREGADFELAVTEDSIILTVRQCPAIAHLRKLGMGVSPLFCLSTTVVNEALCQGTPWRTETVKTSDCSCVQRFTREAKP